MTRPLRLAFLWHQHQPYYLNEGEFLLPWVRLHGVKDYVDLTLLLSEFPQLKQSFNLVPSLLRQIEQYVDGSAQDAVQRLTRLNAASLEASEKREILKRFFLCNADRMIQPYPRFHELFQRSRNDESALREFGPAEWRDLQAWYNLTWVGPLMRERYKLGKYFERGRDFSEADKIDILDVHARILADIIPTLQNAIDSGQAEVSVSPLYHPIVPLLADSDIAKVALPHAPMPRRFSFEHDAYEQVRRARDVYGATFGRKPQGMWPSEGSVSDATLNAIAAAGFGWLATDEKILQRTRATTYEPTDKFFPQRFRTDAGDVTVFFRDNALSDAVGFHYARRAADEAVDDFIGHLFNIRRDLIERYGESVLEEAVVPIILDGENCWEYYENNGLPFLRALYSRIVNQPELTTVTFSEVLESQSAQLSANSVGPSRREHLESIFPGSWINADFDIWIGSESENAAWNLLHTARHVFENVKSLLTADQAEEAYVTLLLAEGSDWFWWYGEDHEAENKEMFDELFRAHLNKFYTICGLAAPESLKQSLMHTPEAPASLHVRPQRQYLGASVDEGPRDLDAWEGAGSVILSESASSTMHEVDTNVDRLLFGTNDKYVHFCFAPGVDSDISIVWLNILGDRPSTIALFADDHLDAASEERKSESPGRNAVCRLDMRDLEPRVETDGSLLLDVYIMVREGDDARRMIPRPDSGVKSMELSILPVVGRAVN